MAEINRCHQRATQIKRGADVENLIIHLFTQFFPPILNLPFTL